MTQLELDSPAETTPTTVLIGITGNIGSGKSLLANLLRTRGHTVFSSDETAQMLMASRPDLQAHIKKNFGDAVFLPDGSVDKKHLASLVFGETPDHHARLALLNRLVHPLVLEEHQSQIRQCLDKGILLVFIETALLYEVGLDDAFDYVIMVDAPEDVRLQRAMKRSGASEKDIRHRMKEQLSATEKKKLADFVLDNSSTPEALESALSALLPILEVLPPRSDDNEEDDHE